MGETRGIGIGIAGQEEHETVTARREMRFIGCTYSLFFVFQHFLSFDYEAGDVAASGSYVKPLLPIHCYLFRAIIVVACGGKGTGKMNPS